MRYSQYENYDVECRLLGAERYCKKYSGSPCCFFCKEKQLCRQACNDYFIKTIENNTVTVTSAEGDGSLESV